MSDDSLDSMLESMLSAANFPQTSPVIIDGWLDVHGGSAELYEKIARFFCCLARKYARVDILWTARSYYRKTNANAGNVVDGVQVEFDLTFEQRRCVLPRQRRDQLLYAEEKLVQLRPDLTNRPNLVAVYSAVDRAKMADPTATEQLHNLARLSDLAGLIELTESTESTGLTELTESTEWSQLPEYAQLTYSALDPMACVASAEASFAIDRPDKGMAWLKIANMIWCELHILSPANRMRIRTGKDVDLSDLARNWFRSDVPGAMADLAFYAVNFSNMEALKSTTFGRYMESYKVIVLFVFPYFPCINYLYSFPGWGS